MDPEQEKRCQPLLDKVPQGYLYYPLVFINDELAIVGSAEYYEILNAVRQSMAEPAEKK